ncbi:MAG TPA: hypothetical protein VK943_05080 [Arenibaculum sp.]|nr:hypothetical protein [Arenibaculum sp.]
MRFAAAGSRFLGLALALLMLAAIAFVPDSASAAAPAMHGHHHDVQAGPDAVPAEAGPADGCGDGDAGGHGGGHGSGCCMAGACAAMCGGVVPPVAGLPVPPGTRSADAMKQPPRHGQAVTPDLPPPRARA